MSSAVSKLKHSEPHSAQEQEAVDQIFSVFDEDNSGALEGAEVHKLFAALYPSASTQGIRELLSYTAIDVGEHVSQGELQEALGKRAEFPALLKDLGSWSRARVPLRRKLTQKLSLRSTGIAPEKTK